MHQRQPFSGFLYSNLTVFINPGYKDPQNTGSKQIEAPQIEALGKDGFFCSDRHSLISTMRLYQQQLFHKKKNQDI